MSASARPFERELSASALETLLHPMAPDDFFRDIFERRHAVVRRNCRTYHSALFSLADVDALTAQIRLWPSAHTLKAVKSENGRAVTQPIPSMSDGTPRIHALYRAYANGYTIVANSIDARWPQISVFCRQLEAAFRSRVKANIYLTPSGAQGFASHYDTHDVFILQIQGSKAWRVYGAERRLPMPGDSELFPVRRPEAIDELTLDAGDLLYIPRGHVHDARTSATSSLHLTVDVEAVRWAELMCDAVMLAARYDERLREGVPPRFLQGGEGTGPIEDRVRHLLRSVAEGLRGDEVFEHRTREFLSSSEPARAGHFVSIDQARDIHLDTLLHRRDSATCIVSVQGDQASIQFPGNIVSGPAYLEPALRFIAAAPSSFTAGDMPGSLGDNARLVLLQRLVQEGLLAVEVPGT